MPKGSFLSDTFEQLTEFGQSTAKKSVQSVKQTFDPLKLAEKAMGKNEDRGIEQLEKGKSKKTNHTPLDFEKLQNQYGLQDKAKAETLRHRLFQLVKQGEEKVLEDKKRKKLEKERAISYEELEKKRRAEEQKKLEEALPMPRGKIRRSIFSPKKIVQRQHTELRPATGKQ